LMTGILQSRSVTSGIVVGLTVGVGVAIGFSAAVGNGSTVGLGSVGVTVGVWSSPVMPLVLHQFGYEG